MSITNFDELKSNFYSDWDRVGAHQSRNIIKDLPSWKDIIYILNKASRREVSEWDILRFKDRQTSDFEVWYKDVLGVKKVNYKGSLAIIESDINLFFSIFFSSNDIANVVSKEIDDQINLINKGFNIVTDFNSLKISLSDKFVTWESHTWHTCIMQLEGKNDWSLRDQRTGFEASYLLEPGDCLFFKEGIDHQVSNKEPRSSLVGRFILGETNE